MAETGIPGPSGWLRTGDVWTALSEPFLRKDITSSGGSDKEASDRLLCSLGSAMNNAHRPVGLPEPFKPCFRDEGTAEQSGKGAGI